MLTLHSLKSKGTTKSGKRLGRGDSSGAGSYSGKGRKGQRARSGTAGFAQRGLKQFVFQIPKIRGFVPRFPKRAVVNLSSLETIGMTTIQPINLVQAGIISTERFGVKILGKGKLTKKIEIYVHECSGTAREAIEKQGGKIHIISDARNKKKTKTKPKTKKTQ